MKYLRKVICKELKINAIFEDQSHALRLFTKLYDNGFNVQLEDLFTHEDIKTDDHKFEKLLRKVVFY